MAASRPSVFIGCSSERLDDARAVEGHLHDAADATKWTDVEVTSGSTVLEWLVKKLWDFDFAVMILSPDDVVESRDAVGRAPRDNVVFELGLFMGRLGRERTFILQEQDVDLKLPSDLGSVITLRYRRRDNLKAALSVPCTEIRRGIASLGSFTGLSKDHDEPSLKAKVARLRLDMQQRNFVPDLIIGISRGGLPVAALLSRQIGGAPKVPTMSLSAYPGFKNAFNRIVLARDSFDREVGPIQIVIVDDVCDRGKTLHDARRYVQSCVEFPDVEIATAALTSYDRWTDPSDEPNFVVESLGQPIERFGGEIERFDS